MIRLHITAEGQTEQNFVKRVLAPHLAHFKVLVRVRCVFTRNDPMSPYEFRGGLSSYDMAQKDIEAWLKEEPAPECRFTTMFDFYALPKDFPGLVNARRERDPYERVRIIEENLAQSINDIRFIPYIQLHEFEALILADPQSLGCEYFEYETEINNLVSMVQSQNPELIDDGPATAPSKRICKEIPEYKYTKATAGVAVVEKIGLPTLRAKCRHFNEWLSGLEGLAGASPGAPHE